MQRINACKSGMQRINAYQHARDQILAGEQTVEVLFPVGGIAPLSVVGLGTLPEPPQFEQNRLPMNSFACVINAT